VGAFVPDLPSNTEIGHMQAIHRWIIQVGEALAVVASALETELREEAKVYAALKKIDDITAESARLKHLLKSGYERRSKHVRPNASGATEPHGS
jgi:hypothetical protein